MQQFLTNCFSIKEQNKMIIKTKNLKIPHFLKTFPKPGAKEIMYPVKERSNPNDQYLWKEIKILSHFRLKWFQLK